MNIGDKVRIKSDLPYVGAALWGKVGTVINVTPDASYELTVSVPGHSQMVPLHLAEVDRISGTTDEISGSPREFLVRMVLDNGNTAEIWVDEGTALSILNDGEGESDVHDKPFEQPLEIGISSVMHDEIVIAYIAAVRGDE